MESSCRYIGLERHWINCFLSTDCEDKEREEKEGEGGRGRKTNFELGLEADEVLLSSYVAGWGFRAIWKRGRRQDCRELLHWQGKIYPANCAGRSKYGHVTSVLFLTEISESLSKYRPV